MWAFFGIVVICATVLYWSHKYMAPYQPIKPDEIPEIDEEALKQVADMDNILKEIYGREDD